MAVAYCNNKYKQNKYEDELKLLKFDNELLQRSFDEYISVREKFGYTRPVCMADIATAANKKLKMEGRLPSYYESRIANAEAIGINVEANHERLPWLLIFKDGVMGVAPSANIRLGEEITSDSFETITAAPEVLMPYGGVNQMTPAQAKVHKITIEKGDTDDCAMMARGCNSELAEENPYKAAYISVVEAVSRLVASGARINDTYVSFSENYKTDPADLGKYSRSIAALLGAFEAELHLGIGSIAVENAMSEHFEKLEPEPAVVSYAVTMGKTEDIISPEFKQPGHEVVYLRPYVEMNDRSVGEGLPAPDSLRAIRRKTRELIEAGMVVAACTPPAGDIAGSLDEMALGNGIRCDTEYENSAEPDSRRYEYGGMIIELADKMVPTDIRFEDDEFELIELGKTVREPHAKPVKELAPEIAYHSRIWTTTLFKTAKPKVVIPAFPRDDTRIDIAGAFDALGAEVKTVRISGKDFDSYKRSVEQMSSEMKTAKMLIIPGRYSCQGSFDDMYEFMRQFLCDAAIKDEISELLKRRDGLILGMGSGFRFLLQTGLIMHGEFRDCITETPELTFGDAGCTWPRVARLRIASNASPWLRYSDVGGEFSTVVPYGEGRVTGADELLRKLAYRGQVATQYVDLNGDACYNDISNPFNSMLAVEGLTSPDGRIFGKVGHAERYGEGLYKNVPGEYNLGIFENAMRYFK